MTLAAPASTFDRVLDTMLDHLARTSGLANWVVRRASDEGEGQAAGERDATIHVSAPIRLADGTVFGHLVGYDGEGATVRPDLAAELKFHSNVLGACADLAFGQPDTEVIEAIEVIEEIEEEPVRLMAWPPPSATHLEDPPLEEAIGAELEAAVHAELEAAAEPEPEPDTEPDVQDDLALALRSGTIRPWFQAITDLRTSIPVAFEALARWQRGDEVRDAADFLPRLQELGLMGALFERILDDGLAELTDLRRSAPDLQLAVHYHFDPEPPTDLTGLITSYLTKYGLPPAALALEIGATTSGELPGWVCEELERLATLGVVLLLDDLGSGFASLQQISSLPFSGVKLCRRYTAQLTTGGSPANATATMIDLLQRSGKAVLAEGIETHEQRDKLLALGCKLGQGHYFAHPQPPKTISVVLLQAGNGNGPAHSGE